VSSRNVNVRHERAVLLTETADSLPAWIGRALDSAQLVVHQVVTSEHAIAQVRRARPALMVLDTRAPLTDAALRTLRAVKADGYTAVVPCVALVDAGAAVSPMFATGADEVLRADIDPMEGESRVVAAVRRSRRDLAAQPTTQLPAALAIEAEIDRRIRAAIPFAACYADLDHFKEFNDRYGYHEGDRVIRMVARVLHDAAVGCAGTDAFVGHVGGDDFMLVLPLDHAAATCELALEVFDTFVPFQYSVADRRAGYYFGKDRRGQLHRVPLMTLSIGVATTERRRFHSAAEVSRLASEMKSFAKAQPGSLFAVDRRGEDAPFAAEAVWPDRIHELSPSITSDRERHVR
jgi:GGDEF domain-containing protein